MNSPNEQDRRRFLSEAVGAGCCCFALLSSETLAQEKRDRDKGKKSSGASPLLTPIAYCGLFCGGCGGLQDTVKAGKTTDGCLGCKSNVLGGHCAKCKVRACAMERKVVNCGVCDDYPCEKIAEYHNDEKEGTYMAIARKNSEDFRYFGGEIHEEWAERQLKRWSCPKCGTPFHFRSDSCPKCSGKVPTVEMEAALYSRRKSSSVVEFDGKSWRDGLAYKTETKTVGRRKVLSVSGNERTIVFLPDAGFGDGELSCDILAKGCGGLAFRVAPDGTEAELVQVRTVNTKKEKNKRILVYSGHKNWKTGWRKLRADKPGVYDTEAKLPPTKWFRLKLVVSGEKLDVFIDKDETPILSIEKLLGGRSEGGIGFYGDDVQFADLEWKPA